MRHHSWIVSLIAVVACAPKAADTTDTTVSQMGVANNSEAARASLRQADSAYTRAGVSKDRNALIALYAPDAVMYPTGEATATGVAAIGKFADDALKDPKFSIAFKPISVEVSSDGTMGYTLNDADVTATGPNGKPMTQHIRDFHVWRKQPDGTWKLAVDISSEQPPASPAKK